MTPVELDPVGIQFLERRRAGRDDRRQLALRQLSRSCFRGRLEERQDALAVSVVSSSRSCSMQQNMARALDASRFAIVAAGEHVWALARDLKDQNMFAPFQLICRRADNGEIVWKSTDLPDYATFDLVGLPLLADGKLFIAAKTQANPQQQQGLPQQFVLAIQPHDGKVLWKTEVGTFRQGQQYYLLLHAATRRPSRGWSTARARSISTRTSACLRGSTPTPGRSTGDTATRPTRSSPGIASSTTMQPRNLRPSAARPCRRARLSSSRGRSRSAFMRSSPTG